MRLIQTPLKMRLRFFLFVTVLTALTAALSFRLVQTIALAQDKTALTVTVQESILDKTGGIRRTETLLFAKRSDGSSVKARSVPMPGARGPAEQRLVLDLSSAEEVFVDGLTESITTIPLSTDMVKHYSKQPQCKGLADPAETILGYETVKVVKHYSGGPAETVRIESWLAPALDCFELKTVYSHGSADPSSFFAVNTREAIQVTLGEPEAGLFEKPTGYIERAPSARTREFYRRYPELGSSCPDCLKNNDRDADEKYYSRQTDRPR